jgi:DNA polymerase-3 subunit gamma/tau
MSHAQKLLPIEQLLSDVAAAPATASQRPPARPSIVGSAPNSGVSNSETRRPDPTQPPRQNFMSPFAADSARKGTPRQESPDSAPATGPRIVAAASSPEPVIMGSAVPDALPDPDPNPNPNRRDVASYVSAGPAKPSPPEPRQESELPVPPMPPPPAASSAQPQIDRLQNAVLQALTDGNQRILVSMLSAGEWSVQGNELIIKIAESQTVVDMSLGPDAKHLAIASASRILGRPVKLKVVSGATVAPQEIKRNGGPPGPGGRSRAEQDPVVRRMQEKFNAEIRTVIDYKEKR